MVRQNNGCVQQVIKKNPSNRGVLDVQTEEGLVFVRLTTWSPRAARSHCGVYPFVWYRPADHVDFSDCVESAGHCLNKPSTSLLDDWCRCNWIGGFSVDLTARCSCSPGWSTTFQQTFESLDAPPGVVPRCVRPILIYTGPPAIAAGIVLDLWGVGGPGTASRPVFDVKEYEERLGHCPRCSSEASIVASASSFRTRNSLAGSTNSMSILASTWRRLGSPSDREHLVSANLGWSLATSSGGGFVSSNCQGQGETPETDCLNRNAELRRL